MTINQIQPVLDKYPNLSFETDSLTLLGYLCISKNDTDKYFLEMDISPFPNSFPKVCEYGERIPRKNDRHVNQDGSLCFTTKAKEDIYLRTKVVTLLDFVDLILIPYLENNSYFESNDHYKFEEHSHNYMIAIYETYKDILGIDNIYLIMKLLKQILRGDKIRPNDICYCGSSKKIKNCSSHQNSYKQAKFIKKGTITVDLVALLNLFDLMKNNI